MALTIAIFYGVVIENGFEHKFEDWRTVRDPLFFVAGVAQIANPL